LTMGCNPLPSSIAFVFARLCARAQCDCTALACSKAHSPTRDARTGLIRWGRVDLQQIKAGLDTQRTPCDSACPARRGDKRAGAIKPDVERVERTHDTGKCPASASAANADPRFSRSSKSPSRPNRRSTIRRRRKRILQAFVGRPIVIVSRGAQLMRGMQQHSAAMLAACSSERAWR